MPTFESGHDSARSFRKPILIAAVVLSIVAAAVFFFNPHNVADVTVPHVEVFAPRIESQSLAPKTSMHVVTDPTSATEDNLYVAVTVHVDNKLRLPIFITGATATLTAQTGEQAQASVIAPRDIARVEQIFPALQPLLAHPVADGEQAQPGGSLEGQVLLLFPGLNAEAWHNKKAASLTLLLAHQNPISVTLP